jgi:hypothetical protein
MVTVKAGALADLVGDIFAKAGCSRPRIGKYLVSANLTATIATASPVRNPPPRFFSVGLGG